MKRIAVLPALLLLATATAFGGVTYDFRSDTRGAQQSMTIDGSIAADGKNMRMTLRSGDGTMFKDGSIVISRDGGKTISVYDPAAKTYFELDFDEMLHGAADMLKNPLIKVSYDNPLASVHDSGDGGLIEGLPTRKMLVDASIDLNVEAMGQKLSSKFRMHSENWSTDKLDPNLMNIFQMQGARTGIEALDKMMDAQKVSFGGRFQLKQVTTVHTTEGEKDMVTTITAVVTNIRQKPLDAATFAAPEGYRKVADPLAAMRKRVRT